MLRGLRGQAVAPIHLLHDQLPAGSGGRNGFIQHAILLHSFIDVVIHLQQQRPGTAQGENLVENAVGQFALSHGGQLNRRAQREESGRVHIRVDAHAFA